MLEEIVKVYVPFTGVYDSDMYDKGRILLPDEIIQTLKRRQKVDDKNKIMLFYRLHTKKEPKHLELTDYFPLDKDTEFEKYMPVFRLDDKSRISLHNSDSKELYIEKGTKIVLVGKGNKILIYKAEDYSSNYQTL